MSNIQNDTNGLGLAGFLLSLVGFLSCGLLSPVGLILSLVALGRQPRGFAVAGVVLGLIGSCGIIIGLILILFLPLLLVGILATAGVGAAISSALGPDFEIRIDTLAIREGINQIVQDGDPIPSDVDQLTDLPEFLRRDPWDRPYSIYEIPSNEFIIVSYGEDAVFGTSDDWFLRSTSDELERGPDWQLLALPAPFTTPTPDITPNP